MKSSVILASTSKYRQQLMQRLRIPFVAMPPTADEETAKQAFLKRHPNLDLETAKQLAAELSLVKANSLASQADVVIGSDQICFYNGAILGKPGSFEKACSTLRSLSGQTHFLLTAVTVVTKGKPTTWVHESRLTMRALSDEDIENSVRADNALDCAGGYKLEESGITLMEKIECADWTAIQGLPLIALGKILRSEKS